MSNDTNEKWGEACKQLVSLLASTYTKNGGNEEISEDDYSNLYYKKRKSSAQSVWDDLDALRVPKLSGSTLQKQHADLAKNDFSKFNGLGLVNGLRRLFDFQLAGNYDHKGDLIMPEFMEDNRLKFDYLPKRRLAPINCVHPNESIIKTVSLIGTYPVKLGVTRVCFMQLDINEDRMPLAGTLTLYDVRSKGNIWNKRTFASIDNIQIIDKDPQVATNPDKKDTKAYATKATSHEERTISETIAEKSYMYFLQFRDRTDASTIAYFQLVVELPDNLKSYNRLASRAPQHSDNAPRPLFKASFSSINNSYARHGPTSGLAHFWEASEIEFSDLVAYLKNREIPKDDKPRTALLKRNREIFNETSSRLNEQFLSFSHPVLGNAKPFEADDLGNYLGCFLFPESGTVPGILFSLKLTERGTAEFKFKYDPKSLIYSGYFRRDGESLLVKISFENANETLLIRVPLKTEIQPMVGVFVGKIGKELDQGKFYCEPLLLEKVVSLDQDDSEIDKLLANHQLLSEFLQVSNGFLRAREFLDRILNDSFAKQISGLKPLQANEFPRHFKYFAYNVPTTYRDNEKVGHTIEKCDLQFSEDYSQATLLADDVKVYVGNVFFDQKIIFILFEEKDSSQNNFFTIHLDIREVKNLKDVNAVFGISTYCYKRIESKMIALVRVDDDNNRAVAKYQLNQINPDQLRHKTATTLAEAEKKKTELLASLMEDDKNYKGAVSYIAGRTNRHIHVSSGSGNREHFRPRDTSSREPYFYAALYLTQRIENEKITDHKILWKTMNFFFEAYLHQYASEHFEGDLLENRLNNSVGDEIGDRLNDISLEKDYLKKIYKKIKNDDIKAYVRSLWPFAEEIVKSRTKANNRY